MNKVFSLFLVCALFTGCNLIQEPVKEIGKKEVKEETNDYIIEAVYPEFNKPAGLNEYLTDIVKSEIKNFKNEATADYMDDMEGFENMKSGYYVDYSVCGIYEDKVSLAFTNYLYIKGAAHGNSYSIMINYDTEKNKIIELKDLFKEDSDYLEKLSDLSSRQLKEKFLNDEFAADDWIDEGTSSTSENFQNFCLEENDLVIVFDPYHVAPYAAGPQEVRISYKELKEILEEI